MEDWSHGVIKQRSRTVIQRFKPGDLITGTLSLDRPNIIALILSRTTGSYQYPAIYEVLVDENLMQLNCSYADCYFEKLV